MALASNLMFQIAALGLLSGVQFTKKISMLGTQIPIAVSDCVIAPFVLYFCLFNLSKVRNFLTQLSIRLKLLLFLISGFFLFSLLNGIYNFGEVSQWALINKFLGFHLCLLYFLFAAFVAVELAEQNLNECFWLALCFCSASVLFSIFGYLFFYSDESTPGLWGGRFIGFSANPNAYSFIVCIFFLILSLWRPSSVFRSEFHIFASIILLGIIMAGSRASFVAITVTFVFICFLQIKQKEEKLISLTLIGAVFSSVGLTMILLLLIEEFYGHLHLPYHFQILQPLISVLENGLSVQSLRIQQANVAFETWFLNPLFGNGLGFIIEQKNTEVGGMVIHNTSLWLLSELGLVGYIMVVFLFFSISAEVYKNTGRKYNHLNYFIWSLILFFFVFSMFHDILNQRILWIVLGFAFGHSIRFKGL